MRKVEGQKQDLHTVGTHETRRRPFARFTLAVGAFSAALFIANNPQAPADILNSALDVLNGPENVTVDEEAMQLITDSEPIAE